MLKILLVVTCDNVSGEQNTVVGAMMPGFEKIWGEQCQQRQRKLVGWVQLSS